MFKILTIAFFVLMAYQPTSIYSFEVAAANGGTIDFSQYEGKRILIVNTATQSSLTSQFAQLQQLQDSNANDLVVIAFPSNSFGAEPLSNAALTSYMDSVYNISFPIAAKVDMNDSPIYHWLSTKDENGQMQIRLRGNFEKYLINKQGNLVGYFDSTITPLSSIMQTALQAHQ
ncbi:MAG TPA: glutathione peroxidase [Flavipsychrobacter sp.]|nr:glutathione peroxidase [Flavipsychrobacter sp.]